MLAQFRLPAAAAHYPLLPIPGHPESAKAAYSVRAYIVVRQYPADGRFSSERAVGVWHVGHGKPVVDAKSTTNRRQQNDTRNARYRARMWQSSALSATGLRRTAYMADFLPR